jgi:hypothetical protein
MAEKKINQDIISGVGVITYSLSSDNDKLSGLSSESMIKMIYQ